MSLLLSLKTGGATVKTTTATCGLTIDAACTPYSVASGTIDLAVTWADGLLTTESGETVTYSMPVTLVYWGASSADTDGIPSDYRLRLDSGTWEPWLPATAVEITNGVYRCKLTGYDLTTAGYGPHTIEVELRDDDLNVIGTPLSMVLGFLMAEDDRYRAPSIINRGMVRRVPK